MAGMLDGGSFVEAGFQSVMQMRSRFMA